MKVVLVFLMIISAAIVNGQSNQQFIVNFDYNKYEITPLAKLKLDSFLSSAPSFIQHISLFGHCDSIGNNIYNDKLSLDRVIAVKNYLITQGIDLKIFSEEKGFGKRQPLNNNITSADRDLNRRVEINITRLIESAERPTKKVIDTPAKKGISLEEKILYYKYKN